MLDLSSLDTSFQKALYFLSTRNRNHFISQQPIINQYEFGLKILRTCMVTHYDNVTKNWKASPLHVSECIYCVYKVINFWNIHIQMFTLRLFTDSLINIIDHKHSIHLLVRNSLSEHHDCFCFFYILSALYLDCCISLLEKLKFLSWKWMLLQGYLCFIMGARLQWYKCTLTSHAA